MKRGRDLSTSGSVRVRNLTRLDSFNAESPDTDSLSEAHAITGQSCRMPIGSTQTSRSRPGHGDHKGGCRPSKQPFHRPSPHTPGPAHSRDHEGVRKTFGEFVRGLGLGTASTTRVPKTAKPRAHDVWPPFVPKENVPRGVANFGEDTDSEDDQAQSTESMTVSPPPPVPAPRRGSHDSPKPNFFHGLEDITVRLAELTIGPYLSPPVPLSISGNAVGSDENTITDRAQEFQEQHRSW